MTKLQSFYDCYNNLDVSELPTNQLAHLKDCVELFGKSISRELKSRNP